MRLSIIISVGLLLFAGPSLPVMSQSPVQIANASTNINLAQRRLNFNRRLWNQKNISNYRYTFSNSCFCIPDARGPVVIEVRNGQIKSVTSVETGQKVPNPEYFDRYNTIPKLFNVIQDAINRRAASLDIDYNAKLGYPTEINVDYNIQIADEEIYLKIENFQKIKY
ncbi:MAG: DUF6174 domain-containing protein [Nostoc sp. ChiSLP02]|nr:DUF6174 domain-containing protein [Nostoc sp. DedSLP05]MDZ8097121.1 DUF6174 domain-containing protein [Nostoc sp. DedSLP01]MDZ8187585.1 DUF6174 domain-containing protein [Nostoc sp. ChiSLP02]